MRTRGFTVVEVLIVISCIAVVAAISYPIIASAKKSANKTHCISNLKQIGVAFNVYREQYDGATQGSPWQMGLPPDVVTGTSWPFPFMCRGNNPAGNFHSRTYPERDAPVTLVNAWNEYVQYVGSSAVILTDQNHQDSYPKSLRWQPWTVLGLRLDGSVTVRTKMGFPFNYAWWHR